MKFKKSKIKTLENKIKVLIIDNNYNNLYNNILINNSILSQIISPISINVVPYSSYIKEKWKCIKRNRKRNYSIK